MLRDGMDGAFENGMKQQAWATMSFILLLALAGLACGVPEFIATPTPQPSPTPLGDTLPFIVPAYAVTLQPGEQVPGTQLWYVGRSGDAYEVRIDGLPALKRAGDSFIWSGILAPSVYANYNLRLTTSVLGNLPVAGSVELIVLSPQPVELPAGATVNPILRYDNIVINYQVPLGRSVPGTTLVYEGVTQLGEGTQVSRLARFSGITGYPYLAAGDSLVWNGRLRDNVVVRYSLRAITIDDDIVRLTGIASLLITE
jgi:hypothetical protein